MLIIVGGCLRPHFRRISRFRRHLLFQRPQTLQRRWLASTHQECPREGLHAEVAERIMVELEDLEPLQGPTLASGGEGLNTSVRELVAIEPQLLEQRQRAR